MKVEVLKAFGDVLRGGKGKEGKERGGVSQRKKKSVLGEGEKRAKLIGQGQKGRGGEGKGGAKGNLPPLPRRCSA